MEELQRAILAIEMNVFAGGRCFSTFSRMNHSCFPNVVYIGTPKRWSFKALRRIRCGEELFHSYLGRELLLPTEIRRRHLWRSKCFECACERCSSELDPLRCIPCQPCALELTQLVVAHKPGVWLREKPSVDGNKAAWLACGHKLAAAGELQGDWLRVDAGTKGVGWVLTHGRSLRPPLGMLCIEVGDKGEPLTTDELEDEKPESLAHAHWEAMMRVLLPPDDSAATVYSDEAEKRDNISGEIDSSLWLPARCFQSRAGQLPFVSFKGGAWRCHRCGRSPSNVEKLRSTERHLGRLAERTFFSPEMTRALGSFSGKMHGEGGLKMVKQDFIRRAVDLASTVSGVLGMAHWAVRWAKLLFVDLLITRLTYLRQKPFQAAAVLLSLMGELWDWLGSLGLAQDPSCFLHGRADETLMLLGPIRGGMDRDLGKRFDELKDRLLSSDAQVKILPLRPLIIDGTISFQ